MKAATRPMVFPASCSKNKSYSQCVKKRVADGVELPALFIPQGRYPHRIVLIKLVGQVDKFIQISLRFHPE